MANPTPTRLENLLASLALGLHDDAARALEAATGLTGSGPTALLALDEFVGGANVGRLADVLGLTHSGAVRLVALTNWSAETIHYGPEVFPEVFDLFDDIVVSGAEGVAKPDREIFEILARRLAHPIGGVFYVDDNLGNVDRTALDRNLDAMAWSVGVYAYSSEDINGCLRGPSG